MSFFSTRIRPFFRTLAVIATCLWLSLILAYVVDKATKLETIYDRIHEVRMRFEVLKRDAEIECWKAVAAGGGVGQGVARVGLPLGVQQRVKINQLCSHGEGHLFNRVH